MGLVTFRPMRTPRFIAIPHDATAPRCYPAGRTGLFSPVRPATLATVCPPHAAAAWRFCLALCAAAHIPSAAHAAQPGPAAADVAAALLGSWLVQLGFVLALLVAALRVYDHFRPKPALHQQFAPLGHTHSDLVHQATARSCRSDQARELMTIRQEIGGMTGKVERQLDHLRNSITTQSEQIFAAIKTLDDKQEDRIRRIHGRIDPLAERVASNKQAIDQHLQDARSIATGG
jgi:hypothetical protein